MPYTRQALPPHTASRSVSERDAMAFPASPHT